MKFSFVAAVAAAALAATSEASSMMLLYNLDNQQGDCRSFPIFEYNTCYTISEFYLPRSAGYLNNDPHADQLTVTFFETGNCGGKWTRASQKIPYNTWAEWNKLQQVWGIAGSIMVEKSKVSSGSGSITQYKPAFGAKWTEVTCR